MLVKHNLALILSLRGVRCYACALPLFSCTLLPHRLMQKQGPSEPWPCPLSQRERELWTAPCHAKRSSLDMH
jgi:hypothetical protein